ncbi:hypothetical protein BJ165DRAFT_1545525 [Panaeolus papilionaceus]|nr:hypothetical protein BJ165DRAFT_1545525 [Panaeolus papilionaceus]
MLQHYRALESAGLPLELFTISERPWNFGLGFLRRGCDLSRVGDLLEWHIFSSIHHGAGTESTNLRSKFLDDFGDTSATPFGATDDGGFYDFIEELRDDLPEQEWAALQLGRWGSECDIHRDLEDAVIFYFKQIVSLLDPSEDIHKPKEIIAAFDSLKGQLGEHWRALTAAYLLSFRSHLVWNRCPISNGIVTVLNDISSRFFPPHVISSIEDAALPFDFPCPQSKRDMLNSFTSTCSFPRWFKSPWDYLKHPFFMSDIQIHLCYLDDYKRIYDICAHGGGGMIDLDNDDESVWSLSASDLACKITKEMDDDWTLSDRVQKFFWDYEEAEWKHKQMTKMKNSKKL